MSTNRKPTAAARTRRNTRVTRRQPSLIDTIFGIIIVLLYIACPLLLLMGAGSAAKRMK